MKKWTDRILVMISIIAGYGLLALVFFAGVLLAGYLSIQLVFQTTDSPSAWVVAADVTVIALVIFILTRKRFREGVTTFWKQLLRNM